MTNVEAGRKAIDLMDEHGLYDQGWQFRFDNARSRAGCCKHSKKTITLSRYLNPHFKDEKVIDTILHEIAHALVGGRHGHNRVWKMKATEIGADPTRCYSTDSFKEGAKDTLEKQSKYTLSCNSCKDTHSMHRKPSRGYSCGKCAKGYNSKYKLTLTQNY